MAWRPLHVREDETRVPDYDGPFEGVPGWIQDQLIAWVGENYAVYPAENAIALVHWTINRLRLEPSTSSYPAGMVGDILERCVGDADLFLDILDLQLAHPDVFTLSDGDHLEQILEVGGSVWEVRDLGSGRSCLSRRVTPGAKVSFEEAVASGSQAAHALAEGWTAAYGRSPNPKLAYDASIRAVEAAIKQIVNPNNASATLGHAIGELGANPGRYSFRITPNPPTGDPAEPISIVRGLAQTLWQGYEGRHGDQGQGPGPMNDIGQAQDALHMAALLVQWCESGAIKRI